MSDTKFEWPLTAGDLKYVLGLGYPGESCYAYPRPEAGAVHVYIDCASLPDKSDPLASVWEITLSRRTAMMRYRLRATVPELLDSLSTGDIAAQARAMWGE